MATIEEATRKDKIFDQHAEKQKIIATKVQTNFIEDIKEIRQKYETEINQIDQQNDQTKNKYQQRLEQIENRSDTQVKKNADDWEKTKDDARQDLHDDFTQLRKLRQRGQKQFIELVGDNMDTSDQHRATILKHQARSQEQIKKFIDKHSGPIDNEYTDIRHEFKNTSFLMNNFGKATRLAKLSPEDLPENVDAFATREALIAYVTQYLGLTDHPSGRLPTMDAYGESLKVEEIAAIIAMPNETATQLALLAQKHWQGDTDIQQEVSLWIIDRIKDLKYGIASVISPRDQKDPHRLAQGAEKVRHLTDILMITNNPKTRKDLIKKAMVWYRQDSETRHAAQNKPLAVKTNLGL